jgi:hypothetical protein
LADEEEIKLPQDLFHRGVISKLFPSNNMGIVRTESGREVQFAYDLVIVTGTINGPAGLKEGMEIGYDLGWTSKGLRITKIKVGLPPPSRLKRQEGESEDLPAKDLSDKNS